jgi:hypothetical protein
LFIIIYNDTNYQSRSPSRHWEPYWFGLVRKKFVKKSRPREAHYSFAFQKLVVGKPGQNKQIDAIRERIARRAALEFRNGMYGTMKPDVHRKT